MKKFFTLLIVIAFSIPLFSQNNDLTHSMWYSSHDQNMWGPDWAYGIDVEQSLFDVNIDENWGFTEVTDILGMQLGVGFEVGIQAILASTFEAHGFYTGEFDLDYPIEVHLDFPEDTTFDYGGPATIYTDYEVTEGWDLSTQFPPVGVITLDFEYMFNPFMNIIVCVFGCDTIPIIPPAVQIPYTLDTLFHIDGEHEYCIYPCYVDGQFQFCHDYYLPIDVDFTDLVGFNFEAHINLPFVETEDHIDLDNNCLIAQGDSMYLFVHLDVIGFLYVMAGFIPPPEGPQIQEAIDFLNDTISYPIETPLGDIVFQIEYSLLEVTLMMRNYLQQDIYFCPTIWGTFNFPIPLEYVVNNPDNGNAVVETGFNDSVRMAIGNNLTITYPCHGWDSMYVGVQYNIQPTIRNHTWDSMAFSILIEALEVNISIITPFKNEFADIEIPKFELPPLTENSGNIPVPLSSPPIEMTLYYEENDTGDEAKDFGPWTIGPLFVWEIPLGYIPLTWFDQTWELMHFAEDIVFPGTYIVPRPKSEVNALLFASSYCFGDPYSYVHAEAQNGVPPFTYTWSTGHVTPNTMSDLDSIYAPPGYYLVTITDLHGCESYDSISISVNPPLYYNLEVTDILCHGMHTGTVYTNVSGGTPPYFYHWEPSGSEEANPSTLSAGWHYVTISDWVGCPIVDSVFINEPPTALTFNTVVTDVQCHGLTNGAINVSPVGATPPYNYLWSNGATTQDLTDVPAGAYSVTVIDNNNCNWVDLYVINEPDTLVAVLYHTDLTCNSSNDGTLLTVTSGGVEPYNFTWFHDPENHNPNLNNLPAGFYMVSVTDAHNCSDTALAMITEPEPLLLEFTITNVSCFGLYDGTITAVASGGTPDYILHWSNDHYGETISSLLPGNYTVTLTDAHDCELVQTVTVTQPTIVDFSFEEIINVSCFGLSDASANVVPTGGTPPYVVEWQNGVVQTGNQGTGMPAYMYFEVTVTDANGCWHNDSIMFTQPNTLTINGSTLPVNCGVAPGQGFANASGGTEPYSFLWSNGETDSHAVGLPTGAVWVSVTDFNGCTASVNLNVSTSGTITATGSVIMPNLCYGDNIAVASVDLPTGVHPLSFIWPDGTLNDTAYNLAAGSYIVTATDLYNCSDTILIIVNQPDSINPGITVTAPSCTAIFDGAIISNTTGGTNPYNYQWSVGSTQNEILNIRDGFYYLTITDANNCISVSAIELIEAEFCLIVFNTFTPNGDGVNDTWYIENIEQFEFNQVWVYNRNGNLVFSSEFYANNWDGTYNGKPLPEATYYYVIEPGAGKDALKGHVTIIR